MIDHNVLKDLHRKLLQVRESELQLAQEYKKQEMRTPTHFGIGQEATAVGVCAVLEDKDVVYTHHRSHNHYLAKGGSLEQLAAELFGRETGCSNGRGGSVHLTARDVGFVASSAILGQAMAMATGSALSFRMDESDRIAVAFFGDAVAEEGAFYECLSYAALKNLPVLFVCENNGYATESGLSARQPEGVGILERVTAFGISGERIDGNDVEAVYEAASAAKRFIMENGAPYFLECETYRWLEHVGPFFDGELGRSYRTDEEVEAWKEKCPIKINKEKILSCGAAPKEDLDKMEQEIRAEVTAIIAKAYAAPWPKASDLHVNAL